MSPRKQEDNEAIRAERRQQILDAALKVFAERGFFNTRIEDIAGYLNLGKGTIYWYFASKEALFEAVFRSKFEAMAAPLYAIASNEVLTPAEKLIDIADASLSALSTETELLFVLIQAMSTPDVARLLSHDFARYYDEFAGVLAPLLAEHGEPDPQAAASVYIAILDGAMLQSLAAASVFDPQRFLAQIKRQFRL
jgi:AcrR family transcriptional regulator